MINLSIAQNMIAMYQRDLHLRFYRSANIQEQKKGGKKRRFKIVGSTDTVTSKKAAHTLTFLKKYLILFVMSWKVGLIKGFSIQQLCMRAYLGG